MEKMSRKARIWVGATLLAIMFLNYAFIGLPLYRKMASLESRIRLMMIKQARSGTALKDSEDGYIIDVLKKESLSVDKKIVILNCVSASVAIVIISWIAFGLLLYKKEKPVYRKDKEGGS